MKSLYEDSYIFFKNGYIRETLDGWGKILISFVEEQTKMSGILEIKISTEKLMNWSIINGLCENTRETKRSQFETNSGIFTFEEKITYKDFINNYHISFKSFLTPLQDRDCIISSDKTIIIKNNQIYCPEEILIVCDKNYSSNYIQFDKQTGIFV